MVSVLTFIIIQLPPGDSHDLSTQASASGGSIDEAAMEGVRKQYGLDQPMYVQYVTWMSGFPRGDFGYSFEWKRQWPSLIGSRLGFTLLLSVLALGFSWWWPSRSASTRPRTSTRWATSA